MRICLATYHTPLQFQSKTTAKSGKWSKPAAVRRRWSGHGGPGGRCRSSRKAEQRGLQSIDKVTADVTALDSAARVARAVTYSLVCGAAHASADRLHARLQGRRQSDTGPAARCAARRWYQAWAPLRRPCVGQARQPTGPGGVPQGAAERRHVGGLEARSARPRPAPPGQSRPRTDRPRCRPEVLAGQGAQLDTKTANGRLVFAIFAALAEFERALIVERTRAGLVSARARGRNGGRPFKMTAAKLRLAQAAMGKPGTKVSELSAELGITRQTLYRHVNPNGLLRSDGKKLLGRSRARSSTVPVH